MFLFFQFLVFNPVTSWNFHSILPSNELTQNQVFRVSKPNFTFYSSKSGLTEWLIEYLEDENSDSQIMKAVTTYSQEKAGENDTLPSQGLRIGPFRIFPSLDQTQSDSSENINRSSHPKSYIPIRLLNSRNGWGTGVHPTTRLCLEFLAHHHVIEQGNTFLDFGCGSGILTVAALLLGCSRAHGVDIEAEALISTERNVLLNKVMYPNTASVGSSIQYVVEQDLQTDNDDEEKLTEFSRRFIGWHAREVIPYGLRNDDDQGINVCVANILIGQLVRPSMVSTIVSNLAPGAWLCLSGIRPDEVNSLKAAYNNYVDWDDDLYAELAAKDTECSIESYGFDVGTWARVVGRIKMNVRSLDSRNFSEEAVS